MNFKPTSQVEDVTVARGAFYPSLSTKEMADTSRLDGTVTTPRLVSALRFAALKVERELAPWRRACTLDSLAAYDTAHEADQTELYKYAVFSEARALLTEQYRDYDSAPEKTARSDLLLPSVDEYRRNMRHAITLFLDSSPHPEHPAATDCLIYPHITTHRHRPPRDDGKTGLMTIELI